MPYGLATGLRSLGVDVAPVSCELPWTLVRLYLHVVPPAGLWRMRTQLARIGLARARRRGPLDAVIQVNALFRLHTRLPRAFVFDMTVRQGRALGDPWTCANPPRVLADWEARSREALRASVAVLPSSHWAGGSAVDDYGVDPARIRVIGFGRNREPVARPRDWSSPRFLFVGREWERKGGPELLRAFAELRRERPDARLDLVGGHGSVALEGVTAHGFLSLGDPEERARLGDLFARATCFVMPSRFEAFGIVHAEAAAAGIPSIGTTVGGAPEVIGDGGRCVAPGDRAALVAALRELSNPGTAARLGTRARTRADLFTWRRTAERIAGALALDVPGPLAEPL